MAVSPAGQGTIIDPTHPLYGRMLPLLRSPSTRSNAPLLGQWPDGRVQRLPREVPTLDASASVPHPQARLAVPPLLPLAHLICARLAGQEDVGHDTAQSLTPPVAHCPPSAPPSWGVRRPRPCGAAWPHAFSNHWPPVSALSSDGCGRSQASTPRRTALIETQTGHKSTETHRAKRAYVSSRQSTPGQRTQPPERTSRQSQRVERAVALGWPAARGPGIDEDVATSGAQAAQRFGCHHLFAERSLGPVGLVLSVAAARVARHCSAWYRLRALGAIFGAILAEAECVDAPRQYHDR